MESVYFCLIALTGAVNLFSFSQLSQIDPSTNDIATDWLPSVKQLGKINETINQLRRAEGDPVISLDEKVMVEVEARVNNLKQLLNTQLATYELLLTDAEGKRFFSEFKQQRDAYDQAQSKVIASSHGGEKASDSTRAVYRGESRTAARAISDD